MLKRLYKKVILPSGSYKPCRNVFSCPPRPSRSAGPTARHATKNLWISTFLIQVWGSNSIFLDVKKLLFKLGWGRKNSFFNTQQIQPWWQPTFSEASSPAETFTMVFDFDLERWLEDNTPMKVETVKTLISAAVRNSSHYNRWVYQSTNQDHSSDNVRKFRRSPSESNIQELCCWSIGCKSSVFVGLESYGTELTANHEPLYNHTTCTKVNLLVLLEVNYMLKLSIIDDYRRTVSPFGSWRWSLV